MTSSTFLLGTCPGSSLPPTVMVVGRRAGRWGHRAQPGAGTHRGGSAPAHWAHLMLRAAAGLGSPSTPQDPTPSPRGRLEGPANPGILVSLELRGGSETKVAHPLLGNNYPRSVAAGARQRPKPGPGAGCGGGGRRARVGPFLLRLSPTSGSDLTGSLLPQPPGLRWLQRAPACPWARTHEADLTLPGAPSRERAGSPPAPRPISLGVKQGVRASRWSYGVQGPAGLTPCGEARGLGGARGLRWQAPARSPAALPAPKPEENSGGPEGLPGRLPTPRLPRTFICTKGACWLCVRALGPEAIWGALGAGRGAPRLPSKVGAAAAPEPHAGGSHIWPGWCLPVSAALSRPRAPGLAALAQARDKGECGPPSPSDCCPGALLPEALSAAWGADPAPLRCRWALRASVSSSVKWGQ